MSAQNGPSTPMLDALIIGAGAAGVGAAALLRGGGLDNFAVLEATDRIGGRVQALPFGSGPQIMIENGANWISGAPRGDQGQVNPVFKLANDAYTHVDFNRLVDRMLSLKQDGAALGHWPGPNPYGFAPDDDNFCIFAVPVL